MARIDLRGVGKTIDGRVIIDNVDLHVDDGEFVGLAGASGAGKTTLLRMIGGFETPDRGQIFFDGVDYTKVPTRDRDLGIVFQRTTLFENRTVRGNLELPLEYRSASMRERRKRVKAESRAHGIAEILDRWPSELSGGEARMTEIARALVRVPKLLLMDEPLSGIDPPSAARLRHELRTLQAGYGVTTMYASNTVGELMSLPARLVVLDRGSVPQVGSPSEVHASPASRDVAFVTGPMGELTVNVVEDDGGIWVVADGLRLRVWAPAVARHVGNSLVLGVRPQDVLIDPMGTVTMTVGPRSYLTGSPVTALRSPAGDLETIAEGLGEGATLTVRFARWHLFDAEGNRVATMD